MIEIKYKPWEYKFFENNKKLYLSVVCGSVALFEINIELNEDEVLMYGEKGIDYIDELAKRIQISPSDYINRNLKNSDKENMI